MYSSTQATVSHNRFNISRPHYWTCLSDIDVSFIMLRLCRNHSAFNSHNFPRTYTTTYPYVAAPPQPNALTRKAQGFGNYLVSSGCTYGLVTVSFHSIRCEVSFDAVSAHGFARPFRITRHHSCHCVFSKFSLLAGIVTTRPSAFAEGEGFEPPNRLNDCRVSGAVLSATQPTFLVLSSTLRYHRSPHPFRHYVIATFLATLAFSPFIIAFSLPS